MRFSAIGDCVMTAWAVTAIRKLVPDAELHWCLQEECLPVVSQRLINHCHAIPRAKWKRSRWSPETWRQQIAAYSRLRRWRFDLGFDFQGHSKTALMLRLSGARERLSGRATDAFAARLNPPRPLRPSGPHEVEHALALVREALPVEPVCRPVMPDFTAPASPPRLATIQTGAGEPDKVYPVSCWARVAEGLSAKGFSVVALGGPHDPRLARAEVTCLVGRLTLSESLAWVAASEIHLAADTGTGHAAAAYGVPVVSVFGRTDPARFRPWTDRGAVLREGGSPGDTDPEKVIAAALSLTGEVRARACQ